MVSFFLIFLVILASFFFFIFPLLANQGCQYIHCTTVNTLAPSAALAHTVRRGRRTSPSPREWLLPRKQWKTWSTSRPRREKLPSPIFPRKSSLSSKCRRIRWGSWPKKPKVGGEGEASRRTQNSALWHSSSQTGPTYWNGHETGRECGEADEQDWSSLYLYEWLWVQEVQQRLLPKRTAIFPPLRAFFAMVFSKNSKQSPPWVFMLHLGEHNGRGHQDVAHHLQVRNWLSLGRKKGSPLALLCTWQILGVFEFPKLGTILLLFFL